MDQISDLVIRYQEKTGLTLRQFADALAHGLRDETLTHSAVLRWRQGKSEPGTDFLCLCLLVYTDWRFYFALECLEAKRPEIWAIPGGGIWKVAAQVNGGVRC